MQSFNLIDAKWLSVRLRNGSCHELGLRQLFQTLPDIAAIEGESPLEVGATHRLLLALLYRALNGPCDKQEAKALFKNGIPLEKVLAYLDQWHDRFWLIDEKLPFFQIPGFEPKCWRAWTVLKAERNADNAKVLFDHTDVLCAGMLEPAAAAQGLLATQAFSLSCGKSELAHTGTAPSATAAIIIPLGHNLQDTLLFSLVPQIRQILEQDTAVWERHPESVEFLKQGPEREILGFADLYTWRTRAIRLKADAAGITSLAFASGVNCASTELLDPMVGYRRDDKRGLLPIQLRERGLWRDFPSLLPDAEGLAPKNLSHAIELGRGCPDRFPASVLVLGQSNNKAKVEFWRMEKFTLPPALAGDRQIRKDIKGFLLQAEQSQKALWSACATYARHLISHGERDPDKNDVRSFTEALPCLPAYWARMESAFHAMLQDYTLEQSFEVIEINWLQAIREALNHGWNLHSSMVLEDGAWSLRALSKAEGTVMKELKRLEEDIRDHEKTLNQNAVAIQEEA